MGEALTYSKLVETLQTKCGLGYEQAEDVVYGIVNEIAERILDGEEVRIFGFGAFLTSDSKARTARNPRTGEEIEVPSKRRVKFRPSSRLRDAIQ